MYAYINLTILSVYVYRPLRFIFDEAYRVDEFALPTPLVFDHLSIVGKAGMGV